MADDDFWHDIIYNDDGSLNEEKVLGELHDYKLLLEEVPKVYWHITNGIMSRVNYFAADVISVHHDYEQDLIREAVMHVLRRIYEGESVEDVMEDYA